TIIEILLYTAICIVAYIYPQSVNSFQTEQEVLMDTIIGFTSVSLALGVTLFIHFRMYDKQQQDLEAARGEAIRLSEVKSNFLANMSHEIRTPINVMLAMNEMILREKGSEKIQNFSLNIGKSGKTLLSLIENILDMSKIESGKLDMIYENYQTTELIDDLVMIGKERANRCDIGFEVQVDENLPLCLYGDFTHIKQVATNFLSNAVKYTKEGCVTLSFHQKAGSNPDEILLCISVSDTGIGIKEEDVTFLFESFTRGELSTRRNVEGTGLGLAIAKRFTDLMNGHIDVKSDLGVGSVFSVLLPQKVYDKTPLHKRIVKEKDRTIKEASFIAPGGKILVVDDCPENLLVIKSLLSRTLLQVDTVISGEQCINRVIKKDYHIILMDYMMPDMDGFQTLRTLRELPNFDSKVVALTANVVAGVKQTLLDAGFIEYLSKPVMWKELEETLIRLLPPELVTVSLGEKDFISSDMKHKLEQDVNDYGIILEEGLGYLSGDLLQYRNVIGFFVDNYEISRMEAEVIHEKKDWKNLKFIIHSLKSRAKAVGAITLSETASKLEKQCEMENVNYIEIIIPILYYEWERTQKGLKKLIKGLALLTSEQKEMENFEVNQEELLLLLKHNRQPDALIMIDQMIKNENTLETVVCLQKIKQKVDEIEFREAESLFMKLMKKEDHGK
ncbi:MAG TPA: ATP-binding protein, partial [Lachnospiraceae bacterium]|nr:ATP-binding protein [Lachnospiraceae bacterium]